MQRSLKWLCIALLYLTGVSLARAETLSASPTPAPLPEDARQLIKYHVTTRAAYSSLLAAQRTAFTEYAAFMETNYNALQAYNAKSLAWLHDTDAQAYAAWMYAVKTHDYEAQQKLIKEVPVIASYRELLEQGLLHFEAAGEQAEEVYEAKFEHAQALYNQAAAQAHEEFFPYAPKDAVAI